MSQVRGGERGGIMASWLGRTWKDVAMTQARGWSWGRGVAGGSVFDLGGDVQHQHPAHFLADGPDGQPL